MKSFLQFWQIVDIELVKCIFIHCSFYSKTFFKTSSGTSLIFVLGVCADIKVSTSLYSGLFSALSSIKFLSLFISSVLAARSLDDFSLDCKLTGEVLFLSFRASSEMGVGIGAEDI